jgi:hypothetical protein
MQYADQHAHSIDGGRWGCEALRSLRGREFTVYHWLAGVGFEKIARDFPEGDDHAVPVDAEIT